jgi:kynurenine formamidase
MVPEGVGANEDVVQFSSHNGTHMDALCHVVADSKMYNGFPASSFLPTTGADRCGVQHNGTFAGPAKLLDVLAFRGAEGLPAGHPIDAELLEATRVAQGTTIDPGDILLVRTGWITHRGREYGPDQGWFQPGLNLSSVDFIDQYDISAVGVDNTAVEVLPFDGWKYLCVHIELLVNRGVTLMEHLWLEDLAADKAYDLLLAVGALPITGASGGPINPIAIA